MSSSRDGALQRLVKSATKIEPHELTATLLSFAFVFVLMTAYFILRPIRDAMASDWTDVEVSWLWSMTFFFSLVAVTVYGAVISTVRFQSLVPGVYGFFALSFFAAVSAGSAVGRIPVRLEPCRLPQPHCRLDSETLPKHGRRF